MLMNTVDKETYGRQIKQVLSIDSEGELAARRPQPGEFDPPERVQSSAVPLGIGIFGYMFSMALVAGMAGVIAMVI